MNFGADLLHLLMPRCQPQVWNAPLAGAMDEFAITTTPRIAAFLAQLAHESMELTAVSENLNYSSSALLAVFPKYFDVMLARTFAYHPEGIANRVYANRMGNGDEASGDGWRYRGRGPIQLTGKQNYHAAGLALGLDLVESPEAVIAPTIGARVAGWYWDTHHCTALADAGDFVGVTKAINGGTLGLAQRQAYYDHALRLLNDASTAAA